MHFAPLKQYAQKGALLRLVLDVVDFCTYREVREFDFSHALLPRNATTAARES